MTRWHRALSLTAGLCFLTLASGLFAGEPTDADLSRYIKKGPRPPDRVGEKVKIPFPPPAGMKLRKPPTPDAEALPVQVVRHQPEGAEQVAHTVSVTFNQPMAAVSSLEEIAKAKVPLRLEPQIPGKFRWAGTRTVAFEPAGRIPHATRFKVTVPAGTRNAKGVRLEKPFVFFFDTPLPKVTSMQPYNRASELTLDPAIILYFNQAVDGRTIAPFVTLKDSTGKTAGLRPVPREAWKGGRHAHLASQAHHERIALFTLKRSLAPNTTYTLTVAKGMQGEEGPLPMPKPFVSTLSTYTPLKVLGLQCQSDNYDYDRNKQCTPGGELVVRFNHSLKVKDPGKLLRVSPRPKGLKVLVQGSWMRLTGKYRAGTTYRVNVRAGVRDQYDQVLKRGWNGRMPFVHLRPRIQVDTNQIHVIERTGGLRFPVGLINLKSFTVSVYRVPEARLWKMMRLTGRYHDDDDFKRELEKIRSLQVSSWREKVRLPWDTWDLHGIPLKRVIKRHGPGPYLVVVHTPQLKHDRRHYHPFMMQATDLGLTVRYDNAKAVVLATSIRTGKALPGVRVQLSDDAARPAGEARTGKDGIAVIQVPKPPRNGFGRMAFTGARAKDRSFLILSGTGDDGHYLSLHWGRPDWFRSVRTFLYGDRDLYRPGEDVHVFGMARQFEASQEAPVTPLPKGHRRVEWKVRSARGRDLAKGVAAVSAFGRFHFDFKLPDGVDLGWTRIETRFPGVASELTGAGSLSFNVQEYRAPQFKVGVDIHSRPLFFADELRATVSGDYLFGAPMRGAPASWNLYRDQARFSAPNHPGFHFGAEPERWYHEHRHHGPRHRWHHRDQVAGGSGKLDERGRMVVQTRLPSWSGLDPSSLTLEAQVVDENRQAVAGRSSVMAHPGDRYVGIRLSKFLVEAGQPFRVGMVLVDLDGKRVTGLPIQLRVTGEVSERVAGRDAKGHATTEWRSRVVEAAKCEVRSGTAVAECQVTLLRGGTYTLEASSLDSKERKIRSRTWMIAYGKGRVERKKTDAQVVELMPDKKEYLPGETATVMIRAPFPKGLALFTSERRGLTGHELLRVENYVATVRVPIREAHIPNLNLSATVVATRGRGVPAAWANGKLRLNISRATKRLTVEARPEKSEARPGEKLAVHVRITGPDGKPARAEVGVVAVDEAVLSMTGFRTPDPLPVFYFPRPPGVVLAETLRRLLPEMKKLTPEDRARRQKELAAPESMAKRAAGAAAEDAAGPGAGEAAGPATTVRKRFLTTPMSEVVTTDTGGKATLTLELPDNLTEFRLMAVAVDASDRFGSGEARLTVAKPLLARPALPRFANYGDVFDAAVVVNNETGKGGMVRVGMQATGAQRMGAATRMVFVPAGQAAEVAFRVKAHRPGVARFIFRASLDGESDAVETPVPVWVPATTEAFATYGTTTQGVVQPIAPPRDALSAFGGLDITLASTALTGLQDAVRYLVSYPYECVEQTASRILPIFALGDILEDFRIGGLATKELRRKLARQGIKKLVAGQRSDGGWGYWWSSTETSAHLTSYVLFVLNRGKEYGFEVPANTLQRARRYLSDWMRRNRKLPDKERSPWWHRYRLDTYAMALYALTEGKERYPEDSKLAFEHREDLDLFAQAMLACVFHREKPEGSEAKALMRELANRVVETPAGIHFAEVRSEALRMLMHSSSRTDAIALLAFLEVEPEHDLVSKAARALVDARVNGRWETTQANAYALLAMARYYRAFESAPTEFTADMWLGEGYLGRAQFEKKTMRESELSLPMPVVFRLAPADLTLAKDGPGRLYYRIGMRYAPRSLDLKPAEQGFTVQRTYEHVERPEEVSGDNQNGWRVKAGSYVRVHLLVVVPDRRHYVVVDDPLPAGLEIVNLAYKTSARDKLAQGDAGWLRYWISWMFNHRELRDERALHFADRLSAGVYHISYITRATTRGDFVVPPARAEEMYRPEVFGRSGTDRLTVE